MKFSIQEEKGTANLAAQLASMIVEPMQIGLNGGLGAGKTTFVRYFIAALGITTPVSSPTFVIMNEYIGNFLVEHWDLYRLTSIPEELLVPPQNGIRLVEWSNKFADYHRSLDLQIDFKLGQSEIETSRVIDISGNKQLISCFSGS